MMMDVAETFEWRQGFSCKFIHQIFFLLGIQRTGWGQLHILNPKITCGIYS